jgi:3-isopropylmalate/(R)-2-methylmalate dehydratase small subunit
LLTVVLSEREITEILKRAKMPGYQLTIDLAEQNVRDNRGFSFRFAIDEFTRHCLLNGLDDIGLTLQHEAEIAAYEARHW